MVNAIVALAAALAIAISTVAPAIAQGKTAAKALESMARQPEIAGQIRTTMILAFALIESLAIYGLLIAIMLVVKVGAL